MMPALIQHPRRKARRHPRGVTLIEGMIATVVLLIGILGSMQAMLTASQQNAIANKMTRAAGIAQQMRAGLEKTKLTRLLGTTAPGNFLNAANCVSGVVDVEPFDLPEPFCVVDLDAVDPAGTNYLMPGYSAEERRIFNRFIAYYEADGTLGHDPAVRTVAVIVTWSQGFGSGSNGYHRQILGLYDSGGDPDTANQAGVEL